MAPRFIKRWRPALSLVQTLGVLLVVAGLLFHGPISLAFSLAGVLFLLLTLVLVIALPDEPGGERSGRPDSALGPPSNAGRP